MRKIILLFFYCILSVTVLSANVSNTYLKGFVLEGDANQPLEYATIALLNSNNDSIVNGTISDQSGFFKIKDIEYGVYKICISFIGYETKVIDDIKIHSGNRNVDLGEILLNAKTESLNEAIVVSDQQQISYKIDRKVIHVDQQKISSSGTAVDILENYPTITVDIDGSVSLRGSTSFTVLIDDKPSILEPSEVLNQIPASTIESIEIITNPTAKYSSEGTSGIINIITKKSKLQGVDGMVQANLGMYKNYGGDLLLNFRKEKVNFFLGANVTNRGIEGSLKSENWNKYNDTTFYVMSEGNYDRTKGSTTVRGGIDFTLNASNSLSFQASAGDWRSGGKTILDYEEYSLPSTSFYSYKSMEEPTREGNYYNMDLKYTHNFSKKGHQITSLFYFDRRDFIDETDNVLTNLSQDIITGQKSIESGPTDSYDFQIDYSLPFNDNQKFEAGYKGEISNYDKESRLEQFNDLTNEYDLVNEYLNHVKLDKDIHSVYALYAGEIKKFGYQLGLRAEYTNRNIDQIETDKKYSVERIDLFPTAHFSYNFSDDQQFMLSYTRRISRPKDWQLEPFYTWKDAYNLRIGNPDLIPQYIDSYELSFINKLDKHSISTDIYYRITNNSIETIQSVFENKYLLTYENIGSDYSLGIELSLSLSLFKWWKCNLSGNIYNYQLKGDLLGQDINRQSLTWNARLYNTFKIGETTSIQLSTMYNSPKVTAQGDNQGYFMTNASLTQDFLKDFSVSVQAQGIFGMLERSKTFETKDFYIHNYTEPYTPIINFSISYKIRNYKYNRNRQQKNIDMDEGEGGI